MHGENKLPLRSWNILEERPAARFEYWQEALDASHYACRLDSRTPPDFNAVINSTNVDGLRIVECACDPCRGARTGYEISMEREAFFGLMLVEDGCNEIMVDTKTLSIEPGMGLLWDSTMPISFELPTNLRKHTVFMDQERLLCAMPNALERLGAPLDWRHGVGALASAHIRTLLDEAKHIDADRGPAAAELLLHLISAALDQPDDTPFTSTQARLFSRIDAFVSTHLDDPDLGPKSIAAALGISVRSLHLLFSRRNMTVSRCILERRLEHCRSDLVTRAHASITEIAFRWGFNDAAHFSRAFRKQYGETASAYRSRALSSGHCPEQALN